MLLDSGFKILERNSPQHVLRKEGKKTTTNTSILNTPLTEFVWLN